MNLKELPSFSWRIQATTFSWIFFRILFAAAMSVTVAFLRLLASSQQSNSTTGLVNVATQFIWPIIALNSFSFTCPEEDSFGTFFLCSCSVTPGIDSIWFDQFWCSSCCCIFKPKYLNEPEHSFQFQILAWKALSPCLWVCPSKNHQDG